jgi:hypothetical protein
MSGLLARARAYGRRGEIQACVVSRASRAQHLFAAQHAYPRATPGSSKARKIRHRFFKMVEFYYPRVQ